MGIWRRLTTRWRAATTTGAKPGGGVPTDGKTVAMPVEPFVFECLMCGKVFDARRRRPLCPECDSAEVTNLSE